MAKSVPRSQPESLSHRTTTAPMNDLPFENVVNTQAGGMYGEEAFGSLSSDRPTEDK